MKTTIRVIIAIFLLSGVLHLANPGAFMWLMPPWLPEPIALIYISGVFELVCAVGLLLKKPWAGWLSALTLLAIWPANIWFAFSVIGSGSFWLIAAAWLRLPLQIPLIYYSVKFARAR
ncbi:MAG: DoxX family protein [Micrococcales bacterium]|nr:DoxX family protein [Micrococcales bacterium]